MDEKGISSFLIELRTQKGITQNELASYLGVSNKTISKWETGTSIPDTFYLPLLAKYYGITVDEILKGHYNYNSENQRIDSIPICLAISTSLLQIVFHFLTVILSSTDNNTLLIINISIAIIVSLFSTILAFIQTRRTKYLIKLIYLFYLSDSVLNIFAYIMYLFLFL